MPPAPRSRARTYDRLKSRAALRAQARAIGEVVAGLDDARLELPTRLGDWRVRHLVAHLAGALDAVPRFLAAPDDGRALSTIADWAAGTAGSAGAIEQDAVERAAALGDVRTAYAQASDAALVVLDADHDPGTRIVHRRGAMLLDDYLVTRLVETVVHADDLADALSLDAFPHDRHALASACRVLADALAAKAPGGSVELRIPPFAVVQCVEGPRHTRGTPPNVVETSPLPWIRLATGRLTWANAVDVAELTASGERSDLSSLLPVMA
ncbi:maleylpyruvate isomerase family mycothiol-dependent enzyme [Streptacidiphilus jiangxiensis]|uniref:TIGR03083 family protein n=1 Tax=Streptacidiphilus jiangxiensis TaxID=235985 RepID=A0A1H7JW88_STRJI|nr:maleylpyruvate isomerase family mycothiol-dependent enzyme [Streptacidiphilus jiangxiensis]SEK78526.1 TIGR03083 family protein [Streptacidiphilus jiangxiensis]